MSDVEKKKFFTLLCGASKGFIEFNFCFNTIFWNARDKKG